MKPIACRTCDRTFTPTQAGRPFCSRECYYKSKRGHRKEEVSYRTITAKGHPIAPPSGVVGEARLNLWNKIGPGPHACHHGCGREVNWRPGDQYAPDALIADHLDWDTTNDDSENLVPSCNPCNSHRRKGGDSRRIQPGEPTVMMGGRPTRATEFTCRQCGKKTLVLNWLAKKRGDRYYRFCSPRCERASHDALLDALDETD